MPAGPAELVLVKRIFTEEGTVGPVADAEADAVAVAEAVAVGVAPTNVAVTTSEPYVGPTMWYLNDVPLVLPVNATVKVAPPFASSSTWQCFS